MQFVRSKAVAEVTGRLGGAPEAIGKTGVQVSIAVKELLPLAEDAQDKQREDCTHWFKVTLWGEARAEWAMRELRAGDMVSCNPQLSTRQYRPEGAKKPVWVTNFSVPPGGEFILLHRYEKPPQGVAQGEDRRGGGRPPREERRVDYDDPRDAPRDDDRRYDRDQDRGGPPPRDLPPPEPAQQRRGRGTPPPRGDGRRGR